MMCLFKQSSSSGHSLSLDRTPLGVLHVVEGLALVVLCSCRPATRRLAVNVLKEVRALHTALGIGKVVTLAVQILQSTVICVFVCFIRAMFSDDFETSIFQGDEELAIDVMDRLSASVLESFIHLTGADQV